uniref:Battenin n=1 Tax=Astyanax mexicanus TaxID=7994 RepID=A0A8B9JGQ2_ASTMX
MDQRDGVINADPATTTPTEGRCQRWRNQSGFWLLGLCNNFAYVVMLSAAHDILKQQESQNATAPTPAPGLQATGNSSNSSRYDCNPVSTAAVLLADILPTLLIKLTAPFYIHKVPYGFRVLLCVATATISFLMVSFSSTVLMSISGVIFASVSSGLGELSFLSLTVYFSRDVLSGWGSGTGGAGVAGAFLYSALTQAGLSPRVTLLIMLIVPAAMLISYFALLAFPPSFPQWRSREASHRGSQERQPLIVEDDDYVQNQREKGIVVFNDPPLELLFFQESLLSHAEQYRWYQTLYQIGVFISRTSLYCLKIKKIWLLALLQCVNAVLLSFAVLYQFLPSVWLVFFIVVYEGLLGGAAYVNIFYLISTETGDREREYAMAAASVGDSVGIALSGALAFPVHNYFCSL